MSPRPATSTGRSGKPGKLHRDGNRRLQLFVLNEEFLVDARHQRASTTSLLFVHTARRYYRLNSQVSCMEVALVSRLVRVRVWKKCCKPGYLEEVKVVTRYP